MQKKKKLDKEKYSTAIRDSINTLKGSDLGNFIYQIERQDKNALVDKNDLLYAKLENAEFGYDINLILSILIRHNFDKEKLETYLNEKINIWDRDNWSEKIWQKIKQVDLKVKNPSYYEVESSGRKRYNIQAFITENSKANAMGENPVLILDHSIKFYENGSLLKFLESLEIKDMYVSESKVTAQKVYGLRGKDGVLKVLTR